MKALLLIALILFSVQSQADELLKDKKYRGKTAIEVSSDGSTYNLKVGSQSKFIVIENDDKDKYAIKFMDIYAYGKIKPTRTEEDYKEIVASDVIEDDMYFLSKSEVNGVAIESRVQQSFGGLVSGPLIVPFKYRLDDNSLEGSATIGY